MNKALESSERKTLRQHIAECMRKAWCWLLRKENDVSLRDAIEELIEDDFGVGSSIGTDERLLLGNVLSLKDLTAKDVMIPYANIIAAPLSISQEDLISLFLKAAVSQIPIFSGTVDDIVGVISTKDMLAWIGNHHITGLKSVIKDIPFIAPTMRTLDLLIQMKDTGARTAVVVDEYGGVKGIVTFSSLIEEIIGDIQYAEDPSNGEHLEIRSNGCVILNASMPLEELNDSLEKIHTTPIQWLENSDEEDVDTIGGVVTFLAGRVPLRGELISHPEGIEFEVLDADPRRLKKIAIHHLVDVVNPTATQDPSLSSNAS
jgi:CBS domain containing-hemolysin-like protein